MNSEENKNTRPPSLPPESDCRIKNWTWDELELDMEQFQKIGKVHQGCVCLVLICKIYHNAGLGEAQRIRLPEIASDNADDTTLWQSEGLSEVKRESEKLNI